jgi:hypothetical protein
VTEDRAVQPEAPGRDLTMADLLDTLRWIVDKDGALPAKGSDREQRFIDLWDRRLVRAASQERPPINVDIAAQTFHSMFHGGRTDLAKCRWNADDKANATMFVNRYARLAGGSVASPEPSDG